MPILALAALVAGAANAPWPAVEAALPEAEPGLSAALELESRSLACSDGEGLGGACSVSWLQRRGWKPAPPKGADPRAPARTHRAEGNVTLRQLTEEVSAGSKATRRFCETHTQGTCRLMPCHSSRGPTQCIKHRCRCLPGYCVHGGVCRKNAVATASCPTFTGGTCLLMNCAGYRGPTECKDGRCHCQEGYCSADDGTCHIHLGTFTAKVAQVNSKRQTFPGPHGKVRSAVCFSGGGARSLSLTLGQLRALEGLGLMRGVDAVSAVSGGSWASAIYMFAKMDTQELLGAPTSPAELILHKLQMTPPPLGDTARTDIGVLGEKRFSSTNYDDLWVKLIGEAILKPFGLFGEGSFMAADAESVARITAANPQLRAEQFHVPQLGRPQTFVMSGALLSPEGYIGDESNAVSLQMSPDWTGSPFYPGRHKVSYRARKRKQAGLANLLVGGGFVETFAFGGQEPTVRFQNDTIKLEAPPSPLSLAKAVGISSAAFAPFMKLIPVFSDTASELIPKVDYWPVSSPEERQSAIRYKMGDGGIVENGGVLAMLQRGAQRIAWFINTDISISSSFDFCASDLTDPRINALKGLVTNQLFDKFGLYTLRSASRGSFLGNNHIFEAGEFLPLVCELQRKRNAGKAAVVSRSLRVKENTWWGIRGNFMVDIVFVYNEKCADFERLLPTETQEELQKGKSGAFANFPFFKTNFQNKGQCTAYTSEQINLLAAQAEFTILQNSDAFRRIFAVN